MSRYSDRGYRLRQAALKRQSRAADAPCALCGAPIDYSLPAGHPMSFTADHTKSLKSGGSLYGALRPAHHGCNARRGGDDRPVMIRRPESASFWGR